MEQTDNNTIKSLLYCINNYMDDNLETSTTKTKEIGLHGEARA